MAPVEDVSGLSPLSQDLTNWIVSRIYVLDFMTTALTSLWISAVPTDEEIDDRIQGIREAIRPAIDLLPDPDRHGVSAFFAEKMNRIERQIKESRARISPSVKVVQ